MWAMMVKCIPSIYVKAWIGIIVKPLSQHVNLMRMTWCTRLCVKWTRNILTIKCLAEVMNTSRMDMNNMIEKIEKVDDHTVRFVFNAFRSPFYCWYGNGLYLYYPLNMRITWWKQVHLKSGLRSYRYRAFQLQQYQKDSHILYKANDQYWGKTRYWSFSSLLHLMPLYDMQTAKGECQAMPSQILLILRRWNKIAISIY